MSEIVHTAYLTLVTPHNLNDISSGLNSPLRMLVMMYDMGVVTNSSGSGNTAPIELERWSAWTVNSIT